MPAGGKVIERGYIMTFFHESPERREFDGDPLRPGAELQC
jgi:hypothetical protein